MPGTLENTGRSGEQEQPCQPVLEELDTGDRSMVTGGPAPVLFTHVPLFAFLQWP